MDAHENFMRLAIEEAKKAAAIGEIPIGAIIVRNGEVIGRGHNTTETDKDPTCHAEVSAIRDASRTLGGWRLPGCSMYVTTEPCHMCAGAIVLARIDELYIGTEDPKAGACVSLNHVVTDERLNHRVKLTTGVLKDECSMLLKNFFRELRAAKSRNLEESK